MPITIKEVEDKYWLPPGLILSAYPEADDALIAEIARSCELFRIYHSGNIYPCSILPVRTKLELYCLLGNLSKVIDLMSNDKPNSVNNANGCRAIRLAVINGHCSVLEHLFLYLTDAGKKQAIEYRSYDLIHEAALCGQLEAIKYLLTCLTNEEKAEAVKAYFYYAIKLAAKHGHVETIKYLLTHLTKPEKKAAVKADFYRAIQLAAEYGHVETIQYLLTHLTKREKKKAIAPNAILEAAANGHLETIKYLEKYLTDDEKKDAVKAEDYFAIREATFHNHTAVVIRSSLSFPS